MKILSSAQIREADQYTIAHEPISSLDLMERAATQCFDWIQDTFNTNHDFHIVAGMGNNAGDGLVIARLLHQAGYSCRVTVLEMTQKGSPDFEANLKNYTGTITRIQSSDGLKLNPEEIIIDSIFGSGLTRPIEGWLAECVNRINQSKAIVIAVDLPSGLFMEQSGVTGAVVDAQFTLTFQLPKLPFMLPEQAPLCGEWVVLDIGLDQEFIQKAETPYELTTGETIEAILKTRTKFSHKGTFGHSLVLAGSHGKIGAAVLSAKACLRAGTGLLTVRVPTCGYDIIQSAVPEAMCETDPTERWHSYRPEGLGRFRAMAIGPGLGTEEETEAMFLQLIQGKDLPHLVLDADALNLLSRHTHRYEIMPAETIYTPHPGEFNRLMGPSENDSERLEKAKEFARLTRGVLLLKGAHSWIVSPEGKVAFNSTGNPGMATGGSGDVLTGIITALRAQGYSAFDSARLGLIGTV
ncbi:NAD(P)H-hydrate dehydratase [bacterium SCSIO 12741]|nr:NAD(P)H-hydrate dehydratase [bacterium SCSIO 12741]